MRHSREIRARVRFGVSRRLGRTIAPPMIPRRPSRCSERTSLAEQTMRPMPLASEPPPGQVEEEPVRRRTRYGSVLVP